jgi:polyphosphate kinase
MPRNLDRRVELLVPILDSACKRRAIQILRTCMKDNTKARRLTSSGRYEVPSRKPSRPSRSQLEFQRRAREAAESMTERTRTTLIPIEPNR